MQSFEIFERSVRLEAAPEAVYAFHEDPRNITRISPRSLVVERVECTVPASAGDRFRLRIRQFGLPLDWTGIWEEAVGPERLVDGAVVSPFRHWRHSHLFRRDGEGTVMTDRVEYAVRFGPLGRLLDRTLLRLVFLAMFAARHRATRDYFAGRKPGEAGQGSP
jgi:ligand-binding SRPBCC domain-containing protein